MALVTDLVSITSWNSLQHNHPLSSILIVRKNSLISFIWRTSFPVHRLKKHSLRETVEKEDESKISCVLRKAPTAHMVSSLIIVALLHKTSKENKYWTTQSANEKKFILSIDPNHHYPIKFPKLPRRIASVECQKWTFSVTHYFKHRQNRMAGEIGTYATIRDLH